MDTPEASTFTDIVPFSASMLTEPGATLTVPLPEVTVPDPEVTAEDEVVTVTSLIEVVVVVAGAVVDPSPGPTASCTAATFKAPAIARAAPPPTTRIPRNIALPPNGWPAPTASAPPSCRNESLEAIGRTSRPQGSIVPPGRAAAHAGTWQPQREDRADAGLRAEQDQISTVPAGQISADGKAQGRAAGRGARIVDGGEPVGEAQLHLRGDRASPILDECLDQLLGVPVLGNRDPDPGAAPRRPHGLHHPGDRGPRP